MWAGPLCVPVGGGPPARSPHASLRLGVVDLEARPGPAAAHRHPPHRWCFSLLCTSHPGLAAHGHRRQAPQPGLSCPAAHALPSTPAVPGVLVVIGVVLKPGYALPPPTGTHRHRGQAPRASRFPPCVNLRLGVVDLEARPSPPVPSTPVGLFIAVHIPSRPRRPPAPRPSPTARPLLSRSSRVALHTGGAWCAGGVIGVVLKPGYALPPPTGTAMGTSRRLYACVGFQSGLLGGAALGAGWRRVVGVSRL